MTRVRTKITLTTLSLAAALTGCTTTNSGQPAPVTTTSATPVRERTLDTVIVSGILQTPDYAAAISNGARLLVPEDWEFRAADERRERQELLHRKADPLVYHGLVSEAALRNMVGSAEVMSAQLDHLLEMAKLPNVTIQVIPFDVGPHGATSGPLFLLSFPEEDEQDSAYVESLAGMEMVEEARTVAALSAVWDEVATGVPSPTRSAEIIRAERDAVSGR